MPPQGLLSSARYRAPKGRHNAPNSSYPSHPGCDPCHNAPNSGFAPRLRHTESVEIEIGEEPIRLGQLLKYANLVMDGGQAKALIGSGAVSVDGEVETRRGRQVQIGSLVVIDLPQGRQELQVVRTPEA